MAHPMQHIVHAIPAVYVVLFLKFRPEILRCGVYLQKRIDARLDKQFGL